MTTDTVIPIEPQEIHIWSADLTALHAQENTNAAILSPDELERAHRFHFQIHRQRFIAARSTLRTLISLYIRIAPHEIIFSYGQHNKPFLQVPGNTQLQFNVSHSNDMAVFAFTAGYAIGVDIEKIQTEYNQHIAQRYFSQKENESLLQLPQQERIAGFYRIWARKEALIKATGKGLSNLLSAFSVSVNDDFEVIILDNKESWSLLPISIHPAYQSAVATNQHVKKVSYWKLVGQSPELDKEFIMTL